MKNMEVTANTLNAKIKEAERAEQVYKTEKAEEEIWEVAVNDADDYVMDSELKLNCMKDIVNSLTLRKLDMTVDLDKLNVRHEDMVETYKHLKQTPEYKWTAAERKFMDNYVHVEGQLKDNINRMEFSLQEMDGIISKKEKEKASMENKHDLLEKHRDMRVIPRYQKEKEEAIKAHDEWQELEKEVKEQKEILKKRANGN